MVNDPYLRRGLGSRNGYRLSGSHRCSHVPEVTHCLIPSPTRSLSSVPRLAFVTLRNNLMVLSLRAMIVQFVALMLIAVFCFGGFLYALWTYVPFLSCSFCQLIVGVRLSRNEAGYVPPQPRSSDLAPVTYLPTSYVLAQILSRVRRVLSSVFGAKRPLLMQWNDTLTGRQIAWWMLDLFFGLDASGFDKSSTYLFSA